MLLYLFRDFGHLVNSLEVDGKIHRDLMELSMGIEAPLGYPHLLQIQGFGLHAYGTLLNFRHISGTTAENHRVNKAGKHL